MSLIFRNYDKKILKKLLQEIGEYKYNQALENKMIGNSKPLSMEGFFVEATEHYIRLCYKYPSRYILMIMDVDRCHNIPVVGWVRVKEG